MKKIIERLLIFIIAIPAFFALVIFFPYYKNLALNLVVIFFTAVGAIEFSILLEKKQIKISKIESGILGSLIPLTLTMVVSADIPWIIAIIIIVAGFFWALLSRVFSRQTEFENITNKVAGMFSLLIYPGFFLGFIILISFLGVPAILILFLFITFGSDSLAWLFGSLFGKNNRGIIAVSPNKSIAGFIGGILGSIIVAVGGMMFLSEIIFDELYLYHVFNIYNGHIPLITIIKIAVLGLCTGIAAILGDLAESAIKRSCDIKDSGNLMLGRGGVLDSIDSVAVAAPVFFLLFINLFNV